MFDQRTEMDVDAACAVLREVLLKTRGRSRRDFIAALGKAVAGTALASMGPRSAKGRQKKAGQ